MVEIFSTLKYEEKLKELELGENININSDSESIIQTQQKNYENLIRKLESDLRNHLKVIFFLFFLFFFY